MSQPSLMSQLPIAELAAQIRSRPGMAREVAEQAIASHEASSLGAYITFDAEGALRQASAIDDKTRSGESAGPLAGIPVSVKDLYGVRGFLTHAGSSDPLPKRWEREGFLVKAMRELGAVIVGKTHTVEFAFGGLGINRNTGTPINPWDPDTPRVPGGSSAGAGVSICEGSAILALGSDTGGSVRIPASATGIVGHRPTQGQWPTTGVVPLSSHLDTVGCLTRTALDMAYLYHSVETFRIGRRSEILDWEPTPLDIEELRIGIPQGSFWTECAPGVLDCIETALGELADAGAEIVEVTFPELQEAGELYLSGVLVQAELYEFLRRELPGWGSRLHPDVAARMKGAGEIRAVDYLRARQELSRLRVLAPGRFWNHDVDFIAGPTVPISPPAVSDLEDVGAYREANRLFLSRTCPASLLGLCGVSIPAGLDDAGMPVGLHLMAEPGRDDRLLSAALVAEAVLGTGSERLGHPPRVLRMEDQTEDQTGE